MPLVYRYVNTMAAAIRNSDLHSHLLPVIAVIIADAFICFLDLCYKLSFRFRGHHRAAPPRSRLRVKIPKRSEDDFYTYRQARP